MLKGNYSASNVNQGYSTLGRKIRDFDFNSTFNHLKEKMTKY